MDAIEEYGELMFGRRLRLRVLLWVLAEPDIFNQTQAARGLEYGSSGEVAKELERLVELGMLRKFGRPSRVGPQNYVRVDHPGWGIAKAARSAIEKGLSTADETRAEPQTARTAGGDPRDAVQNIRRENQV
jgi:hypothetical protein